MVDHASIAMSHGLSIVAERKEGINDNMDSSHYHEFFELYYLESGERYHRIENHLYLLKAGEFIIFPPHIMHQSFSTENVPFKRRLVYFRPETISSAGILDYFSQAPQIRTTDGAGRYSIHQLLIMLEQEYQHQGVYNQEYMFTLLNLLLLTIIRNTPKFHKKEEKENIISQMIQYIYEHYAEDITIEQLSRQFFLSPYHLCRKFKQATGKTIIQYLNTTRILNAQRLMLETNHNFTRISKDTGFSNLTHFNRVFKSVTGMTPSQNRRENNRRKENI